VLIVSRRSCQSFPSTTNNRGGEHTSAPPLAEMDSIPPAGKLVVLPAVLCIAPGLAFDTCFLTHPYHNHTDKDKEAMPPPAQDKPKGKPAQGRGKQENHRAPAAASHPSITRSPPHTPHTFHVRLTAPAVVSLVKDSVFQSLTGGFSAASMLGLPQLQLGQAGRHTGTPPPATPTVAATASTAAAKSRRRLPLARPGTSLLGRNLAAAAAAAAVAAAAAPPRHWHPIPIRRHFPLPQARSRPSYIKGLRHRLPCPCQPHLS